LASDVLPAFPRDEIWEIYETTERVKILQLNGWWDKSSLSKFETIPIFKDVRPYRTEFLVLSDFSPVPPAPHPRIFPSVFHPVLSLLDFPPFCRMLPWFPIFSRKFPHLTYYHIMPRTWVNKWQGMKSLTYWAIIWNFFIQNCKRANSRFLFPHFPVQSFGHCHPSQYPYGKVRKPHFAVPRTINYRCDDRRFWLSAHDCQIPTPTSQNLDLVQQIRICEAD
jgi:hypothetical protein